MQEVVSPCLLEARPGDAKLLHARDESRSRETKPCRGAITIAYRPIRFYQYPLDVSPLGFREADGAAKFCLQSQRAQFAGARA